MIVFDSSALVEMTRQTQDGMALQSFARTDEKKISCDLVRAELASVFRKLTRTEGLTPKEAETYFSNAIDLVDEFSPMEELQVEALREAIRLDHSVYDMFYFVLARRTGGCLFTLDKKLMDLCIDNGVDCIMLVNPSEGMVQGVGSGASCATS